MAKWKKWLVTRFLPAWAREELMEEIRRLRREKAALEERIRWLTAYMEGLETGIRCQKKIIIQSGEAKK